MNMKHIGIKPVDPGFDYVCYELKRQLLYFDKIFIEASLFGDIKKQYDSGTGDKLVRERIGKSLVEVDFLMEKGIVEEYNALKYLEEHREELAKLEHFRTVFFIMGRLLDNEKKALRKYFDNKERWDSILEDWQITKEFFKNKENKDLLIAEVFAPFYYKTIFSELVARFSTLTLRREDSKNSYCPINNIFDYSASISKVLNYITSNHCVMSNQAVLDVVINKLPVPDEATPWEKIIDFRSDPDSINKFLALRNWMIDISQAKISKTDIQEKLEYLINEYMQHMRLYKIKYNMGTLELFITSATEILEDIAKFKWSKLTRSLFELKRKNLKLLEAEKTAPGQEVAYIVKAKAYFE